MNVKVFDAADAVATALAVAVRSALAAHGASGAVMLAGGRTPQEGYRKLALDPPDWACAGAIFLSDERAVPEDSPMSNTGAIRPLLRAAGMEPRAWVGFDASAELDACAAEFDARLRDLADAGTRFPLGILGLGADGHTASLFSPAEADAARASGRLAVPVRRPEPPDRVSVTPLLLARIEAVILVVTGREKRDICGRLLSAPMELAAGRALAGHANVSLWADREAVSERRGIAT